MESTSAACHFTPQVVNAQLANVAILTPRTIQDLTQILDHWIPTVPNGYYILSIVLKQLRRLCSKNFNTNGNTDLHVQLCNLLKKCLYSVANICDSEKFDILWNIFSETLQICMEVQKKVCNTAVEILSVPLLDLILSTCNTFSWQQKRDFVRVLREMLSNSERTQNQKVGQSIEEHLCKLSELFLTCGDYEYQVSIIEVIFRYISIYRSRKSLKYWFNGQEFIHDAFSSFKFLDFDVDCRQFINFVNESLGKNRQVYSFACLKAYLGESELLKPNDEKYKEFWIDFNKGSQTVSFYCEGNQALDDSQVFKSTWKLIIIHRDMVRSVKLYKRDAVRSSKMGHCAVVIEFVKQDGSDDGDDDASGSILSQSYLKFFFDDRHQLSLSKDVLHPLFEEAFQEQTSARGRFHHSSITPLVPVTIFRRFQNRDCNKRMRGNNQQKFEPLLIKMFARSHAKEAFSPESYPYKYLRRDVSHTSDELPDTQSSSDPVKDLKGKLTEQYLKNFSKPKLPLVTSPQLSHVSEERLTEMGSTSSSRQSAQESNNSNHNKPETKFRKMSVNSEICVTKTYFRDTPLIDISGDLDEALESVKLDPERGSTLAFSKRYPRVLLKKLCFNEKSVSWPLHIDDTGVIKYKTHQTETKYAYEDNREKTEVEGAELKSTGNDSFSVEDPTTKSLSNNSVKTDDYKDTNIKKPPDATSSLTSYADKSLTDVQNNTQISKDQKLESNINITENKSFKPDDANSVSDSEMFFHDETSRRQNATPPDVHELMNTEGVATPIDSLEEQLRILHSDNCTMEPGNPRGFNTVKMEKEVVCIQESVVPTSELSAMENNNISSINLNCIAETQQTLSMVKSCEGNEAGEKKQQKKSSTTHLDSHQPNSADEIEIRSREILSQRSCSPRTDISPKEIAVAISDNDQKSKNDFTDQSKVVKKSSVTVSKTSEEILADWEDNLDDEESVKELYVAPCIKTSILDRSAEDKQLSEQKLEFNKIRSMTSTGIQNTVQSESKAVRKESCSDYPSKASEVASGSDERKSSEKYFKCGNMTGTRIQSTVQSESKITRKESCSDYPSEASEVAGGSDERKSSEKYFKRRNMTGTGIQSTVQSESKITRKESCSDCPSKASEVAGGSDERKSSEKYFKRRNMTDTRIQSTVQSESKITRKESCSDYPSEASEVAGGSDERKSSEKYFKRRNMTGTGIQSTVQSESKITRKESCSDYPSEASEVAGGSDERKSSEKYFKHRNMTATGVQNTVQSKSKTTRKESCSDCPSKASEVAGDSDERKSPKGYFKHFHSQKRKLIAGDHSKNILDSNSKGERNKCIKKDVTHHVPIQDKKICGAALRPKDIKSDSVKKITTDDTFEAPKVEKSKRFSKKRKLYTQNDSSSVINAQDFDDSNDTNNDSGYGFMRARKKQRKSMSKQRDKRQSLAGGIFNLENSEDNECSTTEVKQKSVNSFSQSFQLQFSMNKGYNRWYTKYKEECLQKYHKRSKVSAKDSREISVYSDIESEDSVLSWLPPTDEKKSKRRNEKQLDHLNRTSRKYERKKTSSKKFKISSYAVTFANSKTICGDPEPTSNKKILKMESETKGLLKNRKISSLTKKSKDVEANSEKLHDSPNSIGSSSEDDMHIRSIPLSMRKSFANKTLNKTKHHKQLNKKSIEDNIEKTNSSEDLEASTQYAIKKMLELQKIKMGLASTEANCGPVQNKISSYSPKRSTFSSNYSKNQMEKTEGVSARNEQAESLSRGNGQCLSSKNDTKERKIQTIELTDDESYLDKGVSFANMEKKCCNDKHSTSSKTPEKVFKNRTQKKVVGKLKSYKNKQDLRSEDKALNMADDSSTSYGKAAKDKKKYSNDKPKVKSTFQGKIGEEGTEILCSNEDSLFKVVKSSYFTRKNEMKAKHNWKSPDISDRENSHSGEEQENIEQRQTTLEIDEFAKTLTSSKSICHISKELQNAYTESSNKTTAETSKFNGHKSQKKKASIYQSVNDENVIASKQKYANSNDLEYECLKDTDSDENDGDYLKSNLQTNINKILDYTKSIHNISDDLQPDYYKSLKQNITENSHNDGVVSGKCNSRGSHLQPQFKFSGSFQSHPSRTSENISKETIDEILDEQDASQEILVSSRNENEIGSIPPAPKHVSDESYISQHGPFESAGSVLSPACHKSAKNTSSQRSNKQNMHENADAIIDSQDIFQYDENIASSDSEVVASKNQDRGVIRPKFKKKNRHSASNNIITSSQGNKVKHSSQSPKQLCNIEEVLTLQDDRQENQQENLLIGCDSPARFTQDPCFVQLIKKDDVIERDTFEYLSGTKDDNNGSQSPIVSSLKSTHSRYKDKEEICGNETTDHSKHQYSSHGSVDITEMLQKEKCKISAQTKYKNWDDLPQSPNYSTKTGKIHKRTHKTKRKHKALKSKDVFGSKANKASLINEQCTAKSSEEEQKNAEPRAKLMFSQKVLKHEFISSEFTVTCTGDERAIAIEDDEGSVMLVEQNTDLKLNSLLPWEDMKELLHRKTGNFESYLTSATQTAQDHFNNTCKEISTSRQMFLKNSIEILENEIKESEETLVELDKQEEKFSKAYSYIERAYERQTAVEENLKNRCSAHKSLLESSSMVLQQKNEQNLLQKHRDSLQKDLTEIQNCYYKEECNKLKKKLQQRLMICSRIADMNA